VPTYLLRPFSWMLRCPMATSSAPPSLHEAKCVELMVDARGRACAEDLCTRGRPRTGEDLGVYSGVLCFRGLLGKPWGLACCSCMAAGQRLFPAPSTASATKPGGGDPGCWPWEYATLYHWSMISARRLTLVSSSPSLMMAERNSAGGGGGGGAGKAICNWAGDWKGELRALKSLWFMELARECER